MWKSVLRKLKNVQSPEIFSNEKPLEYSGRFLWVMVESSTEGSNWDLVAFHIVMETIRDFLFFLGMVNHI